MVINEKVYYFFCEQDNDPSFVMIFSAPGEKAMGTEGPQVQSAPPQKREVNGSNWPGSLPGSRITCG